MKLSRRSRSPALFRTDATVMPMTKPTAAGFFFPRFASKFSVEKWREINRLYRKGWSLIKIARITGIGRRTLQRHLREDAFFGTIDRLQKQRGSRLRMYVDQQNLPRSIAVAWRIMEIGSLFEFIFRTCVRPSCVMVKVTP